EAAASSALARALLTQLWATCPGRTHSVAHISPAAAERRPIRRSSRDRSHSDRHAEKKQGSSEDGFLHLYSLAPRRREREQCGQDHHLGDRWNSGTLWGLFCAVNSRRDTTGDTLAISR